jgi:uncharacterized membrane protein YkvA (DUF1232 family)
VSQPRAASAVPPVNRLTRSGTLRLATSALDRARQHHAALRAVFDDLGNMIRLVRAWASREYGAIPWKTIALATGALVYFLDPLDVVPDFVPVVGYLDDVTVIGFVVSSIRGDIERFVEWEARQRAVVVGGSRHAPARSTHP